MSNAKSTPGAAPEPTEDAVKQSLYSKATATLRDAHRAEFHATLEGLYKEAGLTYKRRLTPQERALKQIEDLIAANPDLGVQVTPVPQVGLPTEPGVEV